MDKKKLLIDLWDWTTDMVSVSTPFLNALGIPITPQSSIIFGKTAKFLMSLGFTEVVHDINTRHLSSMQMEKVDDVTKATIRALYRKIEKNGWDETHPESDQYIQNAVEYAEDILCKAMNESRKKKRELLGNYLGTTLYTINMSKPNWENIFYLSSLLNKLTLRQIVITKLIANHFEQLIDDKDDWNCITNKVVISEVKELSIQNIWIELISRQPDPTYLALPLKYILPTDIAVELSAAVDEGVHDYTDDVIKSLDLKPYSQTGLPADFIMLMKRKRSMI